MLSKYNREMADLEEALHVYSLFAALLTGLGQDESTR